MYILLKHDDSSKESFIEQRADEFLLVRGMSNPYQPKTMVGMMRLSSEHLYSSRVIARRLSALPSWAHFVAFDTS